MNRIFFLLLNSFLIQSFVHCNTLKALFVAHRHGDRTPVSTFKTDPYINDSYWPDGWGQLTMRGKKRMYNVGLYLRDQYGNFLTDSIRETEVRSSDRDRCIESTQLILNGAYRPKGRWVWDKDAQFNPVPVHTVPYSYDSMLFPSSRCAAATEESLKISNSPFVKSINEKYKNLYKYLTDNCGEPIEDIIKVSYIYDTLVNEKIANYQIPVWATLSVLKKMEELSSISFKLMGFTRRIQKYRSGVFFYDLTEKMKSVIEKPEVKIGDFRGEALKKLNVYSSHDSFITVLLAGLQANNGLPPPFGATVIFELHQHNESESTDETHSVRILYLNETETNNPYELKIPGCRDQDICTFKQFLSSVSDLLINPRRWNEECKCTSLLKDAVQLSSGINESIHCDKSSDLRPMKSKFVSNLLFGNIMLNMFRINNF